MSWFYRRVVRPALFSQPPERIHAWTLHALGWASRHALLSDALATFHTVPSLPVRCFGLEFPNPVGLAAGMDKDADALPAWAKLGFGFTELGAVTWMAQPGNLPPRVFRVVPDGAIINRMGFNNAGAEALVARLVSWRSAGLWPAHPVGVNIGKSKVTPLGQAPTDYAASLRVLWPHVDFFVINVSSPNTPELRRLQDKPALDEILAALQETNDMLTQSAASAKGNRPSVTRPRPILVKVAPDLTLDALDDVLELVGPRAIAGIVATNTTITRPPTSDPHTRAVYAEAGGLSGRPLARRSTEIIRHIYRQTRGQVPIIGVGGIFGIEDAWEKITAGAALLQLYTGLVFEGPGLPGTIVHGLLRRLQQEGLSSIAEAVGNTNGGGRLRPPPQERLQAGYSSA